MALTTDQKRQVLLQAKQQNPNLTREQALQILSGAESGQSTQNARVATPEQMENVRQISNQPVPQENPIMKVLAGLQQALGKGGSLSGVLPVGYGVMGGVIGGATGGIPGMIAGGAGGAATAERLQQLLDPQKAIGQGGEAGQAFQRGDVLSGVAGNLEDRQKIGEQAATSAVLDVATLGAGKILKPTVKSVAGIVSKGNRSKLFQEAFSVPRALAASIRWPKATEKLMELGIGGKTPDEFLQIAGKVTGSDGVVSTSVRQALANADNVTVNLGDDAVVKAVGQAKEQATNVPEPVLKASLKEIEKIVRNSAPEFGTTKPLEAFDAVQALERKGYALLAQTERSLTDSASNIALEQQAKLYLNAATEIKDKLFSSEVITKEVIDSLKTPDRLAKLAEISPKLAKQFENAKSIADLRSIQEPFVALQTASESTLNAASSPFSQFLKKSGSGGGLNIQVPGVQQALDIASSVAQSPQVRTGVATGLDPQNMLEGVKSLLNKRTGRQTLPTELISQLMRSLGN